MSKRITIVYEVPDSYDIVRITGLGELDVLKQCGSDAMSERDELKAQLAKARARIATLEGHLDWIGWSSDGVERCRQQLAEARAANERLIETITGQLRCNSVIVTGYPSKAAEAGGE